MGNYCVTAISRLSGEREVITPPRSRKTAEKIRDNLKKVRAGRRDYTWPKVQPYDRQLNLFYQNK